MMCLSLLIRRQDCLYHIIGPKILKKYFVAHNIVWIGMRGIRMTVKELIQKLSLYEDDMEVMLEVDTTNPTTLRTVWQSQDNPKRVYLFD